MGYLTTITIYNDGVHQIKDHEKEFGEALYKGIMEAHDSDQVLPFGNFGNMIYIHKSRHADDHTIYVHMGNCVTEVNAFSKTTDRVRKASPDFYKRLVTFIKEELKFLNKKDKPSEKGSKTKRDL